MTKYIKDTTQNKYYSGTSIKEDKDSPEFVDKNPSQYNTGNFLSRIHTGILLDWKEIQFSDIPQDSEIDEVDISVIDYNRNLCVSKKISLGDMGISQASVKSQPKSTYKLKSWLYNKY